MQYQITIRNQEEIGLVAQQLQSQDIDAIYLTDKNGLPDNLESASSLQKACPELPIHTHYVLKNHTRKQADLIIQDFLGYLSQAHSQNIPEIVLSSGQPTPKFDSLKALELLDNPTHLSPGIGVKFNPFLPEALFRLELQRLQTKLSHTRVTSIHLELGTLLNPIRKTVHLFRQEFPETKLIGNVLIPTEYFLKKSQFKPIRSGYFDEKYLSTISNAQAKTKEIIQLYQELGVDPVLELMDLPNLDWSKLHQIYLAN